MASSAIRRIARFIRHLPGIQDAEWLWTALRVPYLAALDPLGRGVAILVGGTAPIRLPTEFVGGDWEKFEPETVAVFARWIHDHPAATVLDVGSSIGPYTAIALFAGGGARVIACESDLASLAALRRFCRHADRRRLHLVHGLIGQAANRIESIEQAELATERELSAHSEFAATRYVCLDPKGCSPDTDSIPCRRLDDLVPVDGEAIPDILLKCDVEGSELHVLLGAAKLIEHHRPDLLLSVHPEALPHYGHSKPMVSDYLQQFGYKVDCLAIDHEEHWWCTSKAH